MNPKTLLSIILSFQALLCSSTNFSDLCQNGPADNVMEMLLNSSADTEALHHQAQLCFNEAVKGGNIQVLEAIPKVFTIDPVSILAKIDDYSMAGILLNSNWCINGLKTSGEEFVISHLNDRSDWLLKNLVPILMEGARLGHLGVVKALVEGGHINPNILRVRCLLAARNSSQYEIVRYILGRNAADVEFLGKWFLCACGSAQIDNLKIVKILCEEFRVDPNVEDGQAVIYAAGSGNVDLMKYLVSRGLDLSVKGNDALIMACHDGRIVMVKFLLNSSGVNPTVNDNGALRTATDSHRPRIVDVLLRDKRVLAALQPRLANFILSNPSSGEAKLIILNWMVHHLTEVDMRWIPVYKHFMLSRPQLAAQFQAVKNNAVAELRIKGFHHIAQFIEVWARTLQDYATFASGQSYEFSDISESFLLNALNY